MLEIINTHIREHQELLINVSNLSKEIDEISNILVNSLKSGGTIFWCGNGGSASDSQHLASELMGRFVKDRKPLRSIALCSDSSVNTGIANDYGYEEIFARQIDGLSNQGDVVMLISTSGKSTNIIKASNAATKKNITTVGLLGNEGGDLIKIVDKYILINSTITARIQEMHIMIGHILCDLIEYKLDLKK